VATFSTASRARLRHAKRRAGGPDAGRNREVVERECATETGTTTRTKRGGGATVRLGGGGHVAPSRAEALTGAPPPPGRLPRFPQDSGTRRYVASMAAPARRAWPSSVPGILSPRKLTVKCARCARVLRMALRATLDCDLPGKTIGTYRKDGAKRGRCPISSGTLGPARPYENYSGASQRYIGSSFTSNPAMWARSKRPSEPGMSERACCGATRKSVAGAGSGGRERVEGLRPTTSPSGGVSWPWLERGRASDFLCRVWRRHRSALGRLDMDRPSGAAGARGSLTQPTKHCKTGSMLRHYVMAAQWAAQRLSLLTRTAVVEADAEKFLKATGAQDRLRTSSREKSRSL
jgi:hypothetical protein